MVKHGRGINVLHGRPPYPPDLMELFVAETKEILKSGCSISTTLVREYLVDAYDKYCSEKKHTQDPCFGPREGTSDHA